MQTQTRLRMVANVHEFLVIFPNFHEISREYCKYSAKFQFFCEYSMNVLMNIPKHCTYHANVQILKWRYSPL